MLCPSCGNEFEVVAAVDGATVDSQDAAVEIARINADRDLALARLQYATENAATDTLAEVTVEAIAAEEAIAEDELAAEVQPEEIAVAVADAIAEAEPDVTVIGDGDVDTGDMIEPLPDAIDSTEDEEPKKQHWLTKSF